MKHKDKQKENKSFNMFDRYRIQCFSNRYLGEHEGEELLLEQQFNRVVSEN